MTLLVRKLNPKKWLGSQQSTPDWLQPGDIEADPVCDLRTRENTLSVFEISNAEVASRVLVAINARANDPTKDVGYVVFDLEALRRLGLKVKETDGDTPDDEVNKWHRNIVEISGNGLVRLAVHFRDNCTIKPCLPQSLEEMFCRCVEAGHLPKETIKDKRIRQLLEGSG